MPSMTSYDELLKQVESLKAENSHLRQELNESTSHPDSALDVFVGLDGDSDIDVIYDDEDGIHVFQQGGGGEARDHIADGECCRTTVLRNCLGIRWCRTLV